MAQQGNAPAWPQQNGRLLARLHWRQHSCAGSEGRGGRALSPDHLKHSLPLALSNLRGPTPRRPHAKPRAARVLGAQGSLQH
jgi:hypothetical protein